MMKLPFEKLQVWQKAMLLVKTVYFKTKKFPREELYGLTSQLRRCAVSIPSNIAEGSQRSSDKELRNYLLIAKGSLAELKTQMIISKEMGYLSCYELEEVINQVEEIDKMLCAFRSRLTASR